MLAFRLLVVYGLFISLSTIAVAENCRVAVAANFSPTLKKLQPIFEEQTQHSLTVITGSTGQLFTQIQYGAPYDVFLAADTQRPQALLASGHGIANTAFNYAEGQLVYWAPQQHASEAIPNFSLIRKMAIANPSIAPYGVAAVETLNSLNYVNEKQLVYGNNITQTLQYIASGNSEGGFIALSQFLHLDTHNHYHWKVPSNLHSPLTQQAILLTHGKKNAAAAAFIAFLKTPIAINTLQRMGYKTPSTP